LNAGKPAQGMNTPNAWLNASWVRHLTTNFERPDKQAFQESQKRLDDLHFDFHCFTIASDDLVSLSLNSQYCVLITTTNGTFDSS
jgi:23S rRNA C2498 (ribose-2'-O)-methylase RlmM